MEGLICWLERHESLSGWVQALGAIIALAISIGLAWWQNRQSQKNSLRAIRQGSLQLLKAFQAIADHALQEFERALEDIKGESAIEYLDSESWMASLDKAFTVIDSMPIHQMPDFESIQVSLSIRATCHAILRNMPDLAAIARTASAEGPVDLSPYVTQIQGNVDNLQKQVVHIRLYSPSLRAS